ncbi:MAG: PAS domain S-box protein [Myxococcales bacterium]
MRDSKARPPVIGDAELAFERIRDYAIFFLEPDGTVASWNEGAQAMKGYAPAEIIGQSFSRFYTPEDLRAGKPAEMLSRALRDGRVEDEAWRVRKDGRRFWADVVITPLRDADGTLRGFVKITRDLTARKQAEEALRQSEQRMRLMIESVRDYALFMLDTSGKVTSWNPGAERLKGYAAREIIGQSFERFYPEQDVRAGKPRLELEIASRDGRFEEEGWRVRKDGSRFWANVVLSAVTTDRGELIGFTKVTRDLTERKRSEEVMIERTRQQAAVAQLGLFALEQPDLDAVIERAVKIVRETMGTELVSVLELSEDGESLVLRAGCGLGAIAGRVPVERGSSAQAPAGHTLASAEGTPRNPFRIGAAADADGGASGMTALIRAPGASRDAYGVIEAHSRAERRFREDDMNFLQAVANVISVALERRSMEEQVRTAEQKAVEERARATQVREALRERDEFISVAAHELRTPLTALQLKLQGVERGLKAGTQPAAAGTTVSARVDGALRQTERLSLLVERLLDVTRIAAGRLDLAPEPFDLSALVRQVVDDFREPAAQVASELRLDAPQALEGCWDRLRLEQVLVNLLSNAVKYGGGHPVTVRMERVADRVRIAVVDGGIGIAPADLPRIFTRFQRAAPVRNYGGLGLGLYIAKHIVEAHGGRIEVSSQPDHGSTFVVDLPVVAVQAAGAKQGGARVRA